MKVKIGSVAGIILSLMIASCNQAPTTQYRDTPTSGEAHIAGDFLYKTMLDSEIQIFTHEYQKASIAVDYMSEALAVKAFLSDSIDGIVIGRELNASETKTFRDKKKYDPKTVRLATDAVAVIVHPDNKAEDLTIDLLRNILNGSTTDWGDGRKIEVLIDNEGSGIITFLRDSVMAGSSFGKNVYTLPQGTTMIDYVATHPNAMGFVGVNQITSFDGDANQVFNEKIKPLAIGKVADLKSYKPYQAYVASRNYPLLRFTNFIFNESHNGLTSGFATFMASDKGQRIILKDGLVPANAPIRLIQVNTSANDINSR